LKSEFDIPDAALDKLLLSDGNGDKGTGVIQFARFFWVQWRHRSHANRLIRELRKTVNLSADAVRVVRQHMEAQRHLATLAAVQKIFRQWHTFHLPFAIILLVITIAHMVTAFLFGYGWLFTS